ncbi:MAG TPA: hypothetical protein VNI01_01860, partial [Elusimicrobiota bacterium]|nr:hypothetical protein [Elusimicrobiota bacterium]
MRALAGILCVALASGAVPPAAWAAASRVRVEAPQTGVLPPGAGVLPSSSVQFPSLEAPSFPELSTQPQAGIDAPHELTASAQAAEALAPPPMAPPMAPPSPAETRPPADKPGLAALTKESAELADVPAGSPAAARSLDHAFVNAGTAVRTQSFDAPAAADAAPSASPLAPAPAAHALLNETASNPPAPEAGAGSGLWAALRRLAGSLFGPAPKTDPNDPFHDPRGGLRLDLYVALIQHILDLDAPEREAYRDRIRAALDSGAPGPVLEAIAAERRAAGFPFEPARLETALDRQTGTRYQAAVELLNNGFDAMGDAIGRFGMGVFQAVGWLEEDGDNLEYRGRDPEDPTRQRWVRFSRARGRLWVDLGSETRAGLEPGTEVVLRKKSPIRQAELRGYLRQKLGLSRRGAVVEAGPEADHVLNDLSAYRTVDGEAVSYRLGAASVRFEVGAGGRELRFRDSGRGLSAAATAEALPVPGVSTNRSNAALARDLQEGAARPRSEELFYRPGAPASRGSVVLLVGGTEVETLAVEGQD